MAGSEIDAIFAGKASSSKLAKESAPLSSVVESKVTHQKEKKKKKRKKSDLAIAEKSEIAEVHDDNVRVKKRSLMTSEGSEKGLRGSKKDKKTAETILDPSKVIEAKMSSKTKKPLQKLSEEDEGFRDTRGKNRKRTEDGYPIYSAEELKIDGNSGGTPLCPFDCDCCH